jgi:4-aminobutyrate aminotransferase-like enzyme
MDRGVFVFCRYNMLFIAPPLTISEEEMMIGVRAVDEVLSIADEVAATT